MAFLAEQDKVQSLVICFSWEDAFNLLWIVVARALEVPLHSICWFASKNSMYVI